MKSLCRTLSTCIVLAGLMAAPAQAAVFESDDFSGTNLNFQLWSIQDPVGGAGFSIVDNELAISIPGGINHDVWSTGNDSARVMQVTDNVDFEIEVKFSSHLTRQYQMQGILVEQDGNKFLRFDFYSDGENVRIFSAVFTDGLPSNIYDSIINPGIGATYMRVTRTGNQWTQSYSIDGQNWTNAANHNYAIIVNSVGPFVGNAGSSGPVNSPAFDGRIDYFFNSASPIDPEDGGVVGPDVTPPYIYNAVVSAISDTEIIANWNTDELSDSYVEYGLTTQYELGSMSDVTPTLSHSETLTGLQPDATYQVRFSSMDASGNVAHSQNYSVFTSALPTFDIWYGNNQSLGAIGQPQEWVSILGNVNDPNGIALLTYSLNGQPPIGITVGPDLLRLQKPGDFNAEFSFDDLSVGQNSIAITAEDSLGFETTEIVTVDYPGENHLALPYAIDWSTVANIQDVAQVVDGLWTLEADSIRPLELGYDRLIAIGDVEWQNYELSVPITVHGLDPICEVTWCAGGGAYVGVLVRWIGHYDSGAQPRAKWWPMGALAGIKWYDINQSYLEVIRGSDGVGLNSDGFSFPLGVPHILKIRAETIEDLHRFSVKIWQQSEEEPVDWTYTYDDQSTAVLDTGSALLVAHHIDASFGDVIVTDLDDDTPPVISNVSVTTTKNSATISWDTDEPATSSVAYGWTNAYDLGTKTEAGMSTSHSITLTNLSANATFHYKITSMDGSGNSAMTGDATFLTKPNDGYVCGACHE